MFLVGKENAYFSQNVFWERRWNGHQFACLSDSLECGLISSVSWYSLEKYYYNLFRDLILTFSQKKLLYHIWLMLSPSENTKWKDTVFAGEFSVLLTMKVLAYQKAQSTVQGSVLIFPSLLKALKEPSLYL